VPHIPIPRAVAVIACRIPRERFLETGRPTWRGWLLAAFAAVVVIGALKLAGVIWTSAPPQWVTTLGTGVTVTGPEHVAPGHGSPGAALTGVMAALSSKDSAAFCGYMFVSSAARCTGPSGQGSRDRLPYGVSVKIGYVAIAGTRAGRLHWQDLLAGRPSRMRDEYQPGRHLLRREHLRGSVDASEVGEEAKWARWKWR
jgi:hypothetical protein